jgi:hypothetical protein
MAYIFDLLPKLAFGAPFWLLLQSLRVTGSAARSVAGSGKGKNLLEFTAPRQRSE